MGIAQRGTLNVDGVAVVAEAAQERFGHGPIAQEVRPFFIHEIGCDDCGMAAIAFLHQFEEDVGLFRPEVDVAELVNQETIDPDQRVEQLAR